MSDAAAPVPEVVDLAESTTAVIAGVVPMTEMAGFFDRVFPIVIATLNAQDVPIAGAAFALYNGPPAETADLEAGFTTAGTIEADGDVRPGSLPGGRVARFAHVGSYDELGSSWGRLQAWIVAEGLTPGSTLWEVYVTEPTPDMNPDDLRTELNWTLA